MRQSLRDRSFGTLAIPLIVLIGLWPALYNRFPIFFDDSAGYITGLWLQHGPTAARMPVFYVFLSSILARYATPLSIPVLNSVMATLVVVTFCRQWIEDATAAILSAALVIASTRLPWLNSLMMPDVISGLGAVAVLTLMIGNFKRQSFSQVFLLTVIAISLLSQTSNLAIIPLGAIFIFLMSRCLSVEVRYCGTILGICAICALAIGTINLVKFGKFSPNPAGPAMIFSKFVETGIAQQYLSANCNTLHYKICTRLESLRQLEGPPQRPFFWGKQRFLWESINADGTLAVQTGAWLDQNNEFRNLTLRLMIAYPFTFAKISTKDTLELLKAKGEVYSSYKGSWVLYSSWTTAFNDARQQNHGLIQRPFNATYQFFYIACLFSLVILAVCSRSRLVKCLSLSTVFLVCANAATHAALVCDCHRYQDKISWLPLLSLVAITLRETLPSKTHLSDCGDINLGGSQEHQ